MTSQPAGQASGKPAGPGANGIGFGQRLHPGSGDAARRSGPSGAVDGLSVGQGERVLVVEDEPAIREIVVETLEGLGYRIFAAANAAEALELLLGNPEIDLLFTDIVMPGNWDGIDLAEEAMRRRPDLPVLFTSGYAGRSPGRVWPRDVPLLQKPYRIGMLANAIRTCIDTRPKGGRPRT